VADGRYVTGMELLGRTKVDISRERVGWLVGECVGVKWRLVVRLDETERFPNEGRCNETGRLSFERYCSESASCTCWDPFLVLAAFESERIVWVKSKAGDRASLKSQDFSAGMNRCPNKKPAMNAFVRKLGDGMVWVPQVD